MIPGHMKIKTAKILAFNGVASDNSSRERVDPVPRKFLSNHSIQDVLVDMTPLTIPKTMTLLTLDLPN